jgi:hypothetical protein
LSDSYDAGQIKRALAGGIRELEAVWDLHPLPPEERYRRVRRGEWQVVFTRKRVRPVQQPKCANPGHVETLVTRGVNRAVAEGLAAGHPDRVPAAVALFDTHAAKGRPRGAGFLVDAIRNPDKYQPAVESPGGQSIAVRKTSPDAQNRPPHDEVRPADAKARAEDKIRWRAFTEFWRELDPCGRDDFEAAAVTSAAPTQADGYRRLRAAGGPAFRHYRRAVLRDHYDRTLSSRG